MFKRSIQIKAKKYNNLCRYKSKQYGINEELAIRKGENGNMAIRKIRGEGEEILSKKSREVELESIKEEKIQELIDDMLETMYKANGVGLAAVQVGILKQIVVIDVDEECNNPIVLINPKIVKEKGTQEVEEGCLSFPNKFAKVVRPAEVVVEALDRNGNKIKIKAKELLAQAISHEYDHLNGIVFVDKIVPGTLEVVKPNDRVSNQNMKKKE